MPAGIIYKGVLTEVRVLHGLSGRQSLLVVVTQQLVEEVEALCEHEVLVLVVDEALPPLARVSANRNKSAQTSTHCAHTQHCAGLTVLECR